MGFYANSYVIGAAIALLAILAAFIPEIRSKLRSKKRKVTDARVRPENDVRPPRPRGL